MGSDRTLPDLFAEVRRRLDALEDHEHSEWVAGGLVALDAIAERMHEPREDDDYWVSVCHCHPGSRRDRVVPYDDPDCLALRKACKGKE